MSKFIVYSQTMRSATRHFHRLVSCIDKSSLCRENSLYLYFS